MSNASRATEGALSYLELQKELAETKDKLKIITIANAIGLEADILSHQRQLERLKRKIFKTRKTFCDIDDFFIVTPYVQRLLPTSSKIVSIDMIKELETLLST